MKDRFFTHKFLPFLALLIFILFLFCVNSLAIEEEIYNTFPDEVFNKVKEFEEFKGTKYSCYGFSYVNNGYRVIFIDRELNPEFTASYGRYVNIGNISSGFIYYDFNSSFNYTRNELHESIHLYQENLYGNAILCRNIKVEGLFDGVLDNNYFDIEIVYGVDEYDFVQAISNEISSDFYNIYECFFSTDKENWSLMEREYSRPDESKFNFYCNIYENNTYYFKLHNKETGEDTIVEKVVDNLAYSITLSTYDKTDEPIMAYSNTFNFNDNLTCSVSTDKQNWTYMGTETTKVDETDTNKSEYRFFTRIYKNGIYYFRFSRTIDDTPGSAEFLYFYVTVKVENLTINDWNDPHYIPKPKISLGFNEETESFVIKTQNILLDKALTLKCLYTDMDGNDFSNWNEMQIEFYTNDFLRETECNFYFEIPVVGAVDKNYRIVFYNYLYNESGEIVTYEFNYEKALDYVENELKVNLRF